VIEATRELPEVEVIGEAKQLTDPVIEEETVIGNTYTKKFRYQFDRSRLGEINGVGRTNARLITQVFVMKADGTDTLQYMNSLWMKVKGENDAQGLYMGFFSVIAVVVVIIIAHILKKKRMAKFYDV
jgi:hypothetical protein